MAPRELEPSGQVLASPICKYDIDEERSEPFEFSEEMINDWWETQQNMGYGSKHSCDQMEG